MRVVERIVEHYDAQEVQFGRVYRWCPERLVVECDCGQQMILKRTDLISSGATTCECGADHAGTIRKELVLQPSDEDHEAVHHPWRYWRSSMDTGIPY